MALLAVSADIREELDRLAAHVAGSPRLLSSGEAVGRKIDFLAQEFNREANTLCSKSSDIALTRIGLDLKAVDRSVPRAGAERRMILTDMMSTSSAAG